MVFGHHGVGKSVAMKEAAAEVGIECAVIDLSLCEPVDLVGLPHVHEGRTRFAPPSMLPSSGAGLLVLEELNRAPAHVRSPCLQLLTERRLNDYKLPDGWLPVACANPGAAPESEDALRYDVDELDPALLSRFVQVEALPDVKEWLSWARQTGIHAAAIELVEAEGNKALLDNEATPRGWAYASDLLKSHEQLAVAEATLLAALVGTLGVRWGSVLARMHDRAARPLRPEEIVLDFETWRSTAKAWRRTKRIDLLRATWEHLRRHLETNRVARRVAGDDQQRKNVADFVGLLPPDSREAAEAWLKKQLDAFDRGARRA